MTRLLGRYVIQDLPRYGIRYRPSSGRGKTKSGILQRVHNEGQLQHDATEGASNPTTAHAAVYHRIFQALRLILSGRIGPPHDGGAVSLSLAPSPAGEDE